MDSKRVLVVYGGWDGHQPKEVGQFLANTLTNEGFEVDIFNRLSVFEEKGDELDAYSLIVPVWTMGEIQNEEVQPILKSVEAGVGLAGCHGGMCDAFRNSCEWQWMTGGQWVAHPGNDGVKYEINISTQDHPVTEGLNDFWVESEQYLMHVDPSNSVLATTTFPVSEGPHSPNGSFKMPVIWTRRYGAGKVFYCSLGHQLDVLTQAPLDEIMRRGLIWAAR